MISTNRRILVVDDNIDIHNDFRKILGTAKNKGKRESLSAIEDQLFDDDDDDDDDDLILSPTITQVEYEIESAYQGVDAVEMVGNAIEEGNPFSLIFMDVRMPPGIDGIETISRIWKRFPNVEIIICTAYSDYSFEEILDKLGTTDRLLFLTKPFDSIAVKQMALSLTRKWTLHEEARRQVELLQGEISQRKLSEERLHHLIHHDPLTGLANRNQMHLSLETAIANARKNKTRFALFFVDLERFREVVDTLGYQNGDLLIQMISKRLEETFFNKGQVFIHGDNEFAVLIPRVTSQRKTSEIAQTIQTAFEPHFDLNGLNIEISVKVGIVIYPDHGCNIDMLMRHADMTLLSAKKGEMGFQFFNEKTMNVYNPQRLMLLSSLRQAIPNNHLMLYFQPVVDLRSGMIVGVEALLRWPHEQQGFIPPNEFIPLAERCGLMRELTAWVLSEVPKEWQVWRNAGYDLFVSVNLTALDLQTGSLVSTIKSTVGPTAMPFDRLHLEISERGVMDDPDIAIQAMLEISKMGINFSIDNFGTGYSSLAYLKSLPVRIIKIDQSFVGDLHDNVNNIAIAKSMIDLGHNLGLEVLAEGVSIKTSYEKLSEIGCDFIQGSLINSPVPAGELLMWFEETGVKIAKKAPANSLEEQFQGLL